MVLKSVTQIHQEISALLLPDTTYIYNPESDAFGMVERGYFFENDPTLSEVVVWYVVSFIHSRCGSSRRASYGLEN